MRTSRALVVSPLLLALVACGDPPAVAPPPATPKPPVEVAKPAPIDTSAVTEPMGLLVRGHMGKPEDTAKHAAQLSGMPVPTAAEMVGFATGEELGQAVDMNQPIDFAVALVGGGRLPKPSFAVSIPLKSLDDARAKLGKYKLIPVDNGGSRVEGLLPPEDSGDSAKTCLLTPAAGSAPARLVCGEVAGVEALAPYLSRTYAREAATNDLHVEVLTGKGRDALDAMRRMLPRMATAGMSSNLRRKPGVNELVETVVGDATDFAVDSEKIVIDVETKSDGAQAKVRVHFKTTNATSSKIVLGQGYVSTPPSSLARLPADVLGGAWSTGNPAALSEHFNGVAKRAFADILADDSPFSDKERAELPKQLFDKIAPSTDGLWSYGFGVDTESVTKTEQEARKADDKTRRQKEMNMEAARLGFHLFHTTAGFAGVAEGTKSIASIMDGAISRTQGKAGVVWKTSFKSAGASKGMPAGSLHYVLTREYAPTSKEEKDAKRKVQCHLLVAKDGTGTAVGLGCDEMVLASRLAATLTGAKTGAPTLPPEVLQAHGHRGAFLTPRMVEWVVALDRGRRGSLGAGSADAKVPVRAVLTNEAPTPEAAGGSAVLTIDAPKAAIGAIVAGALRGGR